MIFLFILLFYESLLYLFFGIYLENIHLYTIILLSMPENKEKLLNDSLFLNELRTLDMYHTFVHMLKNDDSFKQLFFQKFVPFVDKFMINMNEEMKRDELAKIGYDSLAPQYIFNAEQNRFYFSPTLKPSTDDEIIFHLREILKEKKQISKVASPVLLTTFRSIKTRLKQHIWTSHILSFNIRKKCNAFVHQFFSDIYHSSLFMYLIGQIIRQKEITEIVITSQESHSLFQFVQNILYKFVSKRSSHIQFVSGWKDNYTKQFSNVYYLALKPNSNEDQINQMYDEEFEFAILIACMNFYDEVISSYNDNTEFEIRNFFTQCALCHFIPRNTLLNNCSAKNNDDETINEHNENIQHKQIEENIQEQNEKQQFQLFQYTLFIKYAKQAKLLNSSEDKPITSSTELYLSEPEQESEQYYMKLKEIQNDFFDYLHSIHIPSKLFTFENIKKLISNENIRPYKYSYYKIRAFDGEKNAVEQRQIMNIIKTFVHTEWKKIRKGSMFDLCIENTLKYNQPSTNVINNELLYVQLQHLNSVGIKNVGKTIYSKLSEKECDYSCYKIFEMFFQKYIEQITKCTKKNVKMAQDTDEMDDRELILSSSMILNTDEFDF